MVRLRTIIWSWMLKKKWIFCTERSHLKQLLIPLEQGASKALDLKKFTIILQKCWGKAGQIAAFFFMDPTHWALDWDLEILCWNPRRPTPKF